MIEIINNFLIFKMISNLVNIMTNFLFISKFSCYLMIFLITFIVNKKEYYKVY